MTNPTIAAMLTERGARYGEFVDVAYVAQEVKRVLRGGETWKDTTNPQREALEMIANKLARIVNGDANYRDSWVDIIGYAQLVLDAMPEVGG